MPTADQPQPHVAHRSRALAIGAATLLLLVAVLAGSFLSRQAVAATPQVVLAPVVNATGTNRYAPLISACRETVLVALGRHSSELSVAEARPGLRVPPDYVLQQRWVLWSGKPELVLVARDRKGQTVWSAAIFGPENEFPAKISGHIGQFAALARSRHGGA